MTVYEKVANKIEDMIRNRSLLPGDRVPSIRKMHRDTGMSVTSILQGYSLLENRGLIESRPQSGYYVLPHTQRELPVPEIGLTTKFPEAIDEYVIQSFIRATTDPKVTQLAESTPCPELLPTKKLCRILGKICRDAPEKTVVFEDPQGNLDLRRQIARVSFRSGRTVRPSDIIITNGGYESWNLCFRAVVSPGERILVDSPTYFGVREILNSLGIKAMEIPSNSREGVNLKRVAGLLASGRIKACFILPHFVKPFGSPWSDETKRGFVATFSKHKIPIIEADVYRDFHFGTCPPSRLKDYDEEGVVIHCGSFSKTVSSGFRLAWLTPGVFQEQILRLKFISSIAAPTLSQIAVAEYLAHGSFERNLRLVRKKLVENLATYTNAIAHFFPEGTRISQPEGGHVLWVQLPENVDSLRVFRAALRENIVVAPGPIFSISGGLRNFLRISFANSWSDKISRAIDKVGTIVEQQMRE